MSKYDRYTFIPQFSLTPNKLALTNKVFVNQESNSVDNPYYDCKSDNPNRIKRVSSNNKVTRQFHNFKISQNAHRNLKNKINWLYFLSKSKYVKTYRGKEIFNFRIGFLTLTLPAKQKHPTIEITKEYFNQLLTELRQRTKMQNYVWRLEFQKNGNVHYHLVTDTYLDFYFVRDIWNRILSKGGYIKDYQDRFKDLSLMEYVSKFNNNSKDNFNQLAKRYALGKKNNWSKPNTVDVKSVVSNKSISNYISKYFSKDSDSNVYCNELDNEDNSKNLRLWFCSRSLSQLKSISNYCEAIDWDCRSLVESIKDAKVKYYRYCCVIYFEIKKASNWIKSKLYKLFHEYSRNLGYIPSG
ncbi:MAG: hypothetical protein KDC67_04210 [Ignavibacteriae bacterium]|nr:hypothetical protein [Ignavibacteriota bacterium]